MTMSKEAVKDKMKDGNVVLLNVLSESEFGKLHIVGSENFPLGANNDEFAEAVEKKYGKDKFFITYCASLTCDAGPKAARILQNKGLKANDYAGGIKEWAEAGFPTEGTDAPKTPAAATPASN